MGDTHSFIRNGRPEDVPGKMMHDLQLDIRIGKAEAAVPCLACKNFRAGGVYIIVKGRALLLCMSCAVNGILKYQQQFPDEKLFEGDVEVKEEDYVRAARAIQMKNSSISESDALELAKVAIRTL